MNMTSPEIRLCCDTRTDSTHARGCKNSRGYLSLTVEEHARLRSLPCVPHGFKCPAGCGATLLPADPLGHRCGPEYGKSMTYSETVIT